MAFSAPIPQAMQRPWRRATSSIRRARNFLREKPPGYPGLKMTPKRLLNFHLTRFHMARGDTKLRGYPLQLTIEATNVCNLRCPFCFTGAGEIGREKTMLQMPLFKKALDELGDYLLMVEFYNWGEPLLNKHIFEMIGMASSRGISTVISTNFSVPFDAERAEKLVRSGLHTLGVSIDGAKQESYEQYRVRGDFELILANVDLVNAAKKRLGSATPEIVWEFHIFPHNRHELDDARALAAEHGMSIAISKGWVIGPDWDTNHEFAFSSDPSPSRCSFLWQRAIVHNDGGVAPCCGTFYKEDDFGAIKGEPSVALSALETSSFREVWNNEQFQLARSMFRRRDGSAAASALVCYDCPATVMWENYKTHLATGGTKAGFKPDFDSNFGFNYFYNRKPTRAETRDGRITASEPPPEIIPLTPVSGD